MGKKLTLKFEGGVELTKADIEERFDRYNKMYFGGKLGKCRFFWLTRTGGDYGCYTPQPSKNGLISKIGIGRNTIWTEDNLRELLVHEMVHMYIRTVEGKRFDGLLGHGRRFRAHCRRLKKDYGIVIHIHCENFGLIDKKPSPKLWERVLLWIIDR